MKGGITYGIIIIPIERKQNVKYRWDIDEEVLVILSRYIIIGFYIPCFESWNAAARCFIYWRESVDYFVSSLQS